MNRIARSALTLHHIVGAVLLAVLLALSPPALAVDWTKVKEREILLFYPGQASWEWALTQSDHSGADKFRAGKDCKACHLGEERDIGEKIISGKKLEPVKLANRPGSIALRVKMAHDGERLHVRLAWQNPKPSGTKLDPKHRTRVTMMFADAQIKEAVRAGCWGSCHDDAEGMASDPAGKEISKYLVASRTQVTRQGGGENLKPAGELDRLLQQGMFLEFWQAQFDTGKSVRPVDGYILEKRHVNDKPLVVVHADPSCENCVLTLSRTLKPAARKHKDFIAGQEYHLGFALHADYAHHRHHYVSLEHSLRLDSGDADFVAKKQ